MWTCYAAYDASSNTSSSNTYLENPSQLIFIVFIQESPTFLNKLPNIWQALAMFQEASARGDNLSKAMVEQLKARFHSGKSLQKAVGVFCCRYGSMNMYKYGMFLRFYSDI